ncbi:putative DNA-directed RNA polymerase subunit beta/beta' [Aeromonas phage D3]|uniref:DNA-directed RNA polymerase subunit beta/beta n=2 Tax=Ludhianavirus TaxID=3044751 RepID=A0A514TW14_9CAUD|nr:putative DNA-directed RNA polymerase subunit beta/beta' [Aeromonas phage D3]YP_010668809.1 putative DNA-directed RNA polymerase subunit beta/beta' [Aeromonas phage D6]QDJ97060.1 putative DNA-directed RNA polymerase subunit beta/beta' [Aeromonas phage D3]QDJ97221.1 putative DNA-directed RNA polymerase subunit beta/beta' [Aeromonas phage D6]QEP52366.1 DNA-directed RNA polymerase [Aeromonas phage D9]
MKKVTLREWANLSMEAMLLETQRRFRMEVVDDKDDVVITDSWMMAMTWFSLGVHRHFKDEPYHIDECCLLVSNGGRQAFVDDDTLQKPIDNFLGRVMPKYDDPVIYDLIKQLVFVWHNQIHNYLCLKTEDAAVSARSTEILDIRNHPRVADLKRRVMSKEVHMADAAKEFEEIMMGEPDFDRSVFALLYRTRGVSSVQSFQLLISRGDVTDLNQTIMPNTVLDSYADGITDLADSLADSKSAGISLISNNGALQDSEWFHKKIHNHAQVVRGVKYQQDCGSTTGTILKIISKDFRDSLSGKYRIMPDGSSVLLHKDTLKEIKTGDIVIIRSVAWCHHGADKPCARCFGAMVSALPYNPYTKRSAVPGLFYGSTFAEPIGQSILKTKHRIGSASTKGYVVSSQDKDYITTDEAGDYLYFNEKILNEESEPFLILDKETHQDLSDYRVIESMGDIPQASLRSYQSIRLKISMENPMVPDERAYQFPIIVTTVASRDARMTKPFVEYLMTQDIVEEGRGYKISLKDFDPKEPAFILPQVNEDLDAYRKRVEDFLTVTLRGRHDREVTPEMHGELMVALWKVVDEKYKGANIIMHDIFLFAAMARDPQNLNYSLPNCNDRRVFIAMHEGVMNRGIGNAMLYGYQNESLLSNPACYLVTNRQMGALEAFMQPMCV